MAPGDEEPGAVGLLRAQQERDPGPVAGSSVANFRSDSSVLAGRGQRSRRNHFGASWDQYYKKIKDFFAISAARGIMERLSGAHRNWRSAAIEISVNIVGRLDEGQPAIAGGPVDE